jgi:hypothetical protein
MKPTSLQMSNVLYGSAVLRFIRTKKEKAETNPSQVQPPGESSHQLACAARNPENTRVVSYLPHCPTSFPIHQTRVPISKSFNFRASPGSERMGIRPSEVHVTTSFLKCKSQTMQPLIRWNAHAGLIHVGVYHQISPYHNHWPELVISSRTNTYTLAQPKGNTSVTRLVLLCRYSIYELTYAMLRLYRPTMQDTAITDAMPWRHRYSVNQRVPATSA